MKTIQFSQRTIILATILFVAGFASLMSGLSKEYVGIILLCIPACFVSQVVNFEKKLLIQIFLAYGLAFAIYNFDTNLYIAKFVGAENFLLCSDWTHWLGIFITSFTSLMISMVIITICNPKFLYSKPYTELAL